MSAVKSYPSILSALAQNDLAATGRVYLLLQAVDVKHSGYFSMEEVRKTLCNKRSEWFVCSWRWLRKLLDRGDGVLWDRHTSGGLWLRSPLNVALALGVARLSGRPVYIPVGDLLGSIQRVKAHFFASFESGRKHDTPISQKALRRVTGTAERTQREYNKLLNRKASKNYSLTGLQYNQENVYELVINKGKTVLKYIDKKGLRFNDQKAYCLYRLPDTRSRVHEQAPRGSVRAINKAINLTNSREMGKHSRVSRMYHHSAVTAAKAYNRSPYNPHYWLLGVTPMPNATMAGKFEAVNVWGCI